MDVALGTPWNRYMHDSLASIWYTPEGVGKYTYVHRVSIAVAVAQAEIGLVPAGTGEALTRALVDLDRILEIQAAGENHQLRAYLRMVQEKMTKNGDKDFLPYVHNRLTSFDLEDTATSMMLVESADLLLADLRSLAASLQKLAREHKHTLMIGRTHGIHAKPITFGKKCLDWLDMIERCRTRLETAKGEVAVGKISGAVGIFSQPPVVEEKVCGLLRLRLARVSTQILSRDIYAAFFAEVGLLTGCLEKISTDIRLGQQTDRQELEEPFRSTGSSAMPHKRNAEKCEQIKALAKDVRGLIGALFENIDTWDERALDQSATERLAFASILVTTGYMCRSMIAITQGLWVNVEQMRANIDRTNGAIYAEDVKIALQEKGIPQTAAYDLVKGPAQEAYLGHGNLIDNCLAVSEIAKLLSRQDLEALCDSKQAFRYLDEIYARFGL